MYLNTGLVFKFGKTRSYLNNQNIYDAIDLNNTVGAGDNAIDNGNTQIPFPCGVSAAPDYRLPSQTC